MTKTNKDTDSQKRKEKNMIKQWRRCYFDSSESLFTVFSESSPLEEVTHVPVALLKSINHQYLALCRYNSMVCNLLKTLNN